MQRALAISVVSMCGLALLGSCQGHRATQAREPGPGQARAETNAQSSAQANAAEPSARAAASAPDVRIEVLRQPGTAEVALRVQNRAAVRVELAPRLALERRGDRGFERHAASVVELGAKSENGCVALVPGAELRPASWPAGEVPRGTYRVVAHACDGSYSLHGEPFELP